MEQIWATELYFGQKTETISNILLSFWTNDNLILKLKPVQKRLGGGQWCILPPSTGLIFSNYQTSDYQIKRFLSHRIKYCSSGFIRLFSNLNTLVLSHQINLLKIRVRIFLYTFSKPTFHMYNLKKTSINIETRGQGVPSKPGEKKDDKYWERRRWEICWQILRQILANIETNIGKYWDKYLPIFMCWCWSNSFCWLIFFGRADLSTFDDADLDCLCRKNNLAAKKSRDARRVSFLQT